MKRIVTAFLLIGILLCGTGCNMDELFQEETGSGPGITEQDYSFSPEKPSPDFDLETEKDREASPDSDEVRALWLSYLDLTPILKNKSEADFTAAVAGYFENAVQYGFNDIIVQVRPFGDAIYPSKYFPFSHILTGTQGKDPGYDPLAIMVKLAHEKHLRIEAWLNPYRVQTSSADASKLCDANQAKTWYEQKNGCVVQSGDGLFYNPAQKEVRELIINGVREIVQNYQVDGIHFDDYFYPTTDTAFDQAQYKAYRDGGGKLELADWRRSNVDELVSGVYQAVKDVRADVVFGISPQGNLGNNYNTAYKLGREDTFAGDGKEEWITCTDMLKRQVEEARKNGTYGGFAIFRYDSFFTISQAENKEQIQKEMDNLKGLLEP